MTITKKMQTKTRNTTTAAAPDGIRHENDSQKPFVKRNFLYMGISLAMIITGFLLAGSANGDVPGFNEDIFSFRRIVLGPALSFLGFVAMAFAIIYTPKTK